MTLSPSLLGRRRILGLKVNLENKNRIDVALKVSYSSVFKDSEEPKKVYISQPYVFAETVTEGKKPPTDNSDLKISLNRKCFSL